MAAAIEHMVWQPVRPERSVLISDAGEYVNTVEEGQSSSNIKSGVAGYVTAGHFASEILL